ncbi:MAG TPA: peptidoglycan DD-metalloendopeptidase family protein [Candidatus Limnocylindria bacterium]|jgi:murein DD-endopeptidase MepM/ murein hydrolase activator NlpD|nr:peptidoglycan DD-metalloendopeptidase family protein [Candidatus Limnocylindria bacterium]
MSQNPRRRLATLTAALLLTALVFTGAGSHFAVRADDPDVNDAIAQQERMEASLADHQAALAALRRDAATLTSSLQEITGSLDSVGLEIEKAAAELKTLSASLADARAALKRYEQRIVTLESDLEVVATGIEQSRVDLAARQALLQDHLRVAYEQSQTSMLEVLLSTDSLSDATSQLGFMLTLSDEDTRLAEEIQRARERLEIKQQTLREGRETLGELRDATAEREAALDAEAAQVAAAKKKLDAKRKQLEELRKEQESQLAKTAANADLQRSQIAEYQRALEGQRALVDRLKEEAKKLDIAYRGRFAWPEKGSFIVTQEYGHTTFEAFHRGIDMAYLSPHCGGPIYAAGDGTVLADGRPNTRYGDTAIGVIIGHSQRLQSWYWHMSREIVTVGQEVKAGDIIGYEGATGMATGCHLHFQVMFDGETVNPRTYLP